MKNTEMYIVCTDCPERGPQKVDLEFTWIDADQDYNYPVLTATCPTCNRKYKLDLDGKPLT